MVVDCVTMNVSTPPLQFSEYTFNLGTETSERIMEQKRWIARKQTDLWTRKYDLKNWIPAEFHLESGLYRPKIERKLPIEPSNSLKSNHVDIKTNFFCTILTPNAFRTFVPPRLYSFSSFFPRVFLREQHAEKHGVRWIKEWTGTREPTREASWMRERERTN